MKKIALLAALFVFVLAVACGTTKEQTKPDTTAEPGAAVEVEEEAEGEEQPDWSAE